MSKNYLNYLLMTFILIAIPFHAIAYVDKESIFMKARYPASEFDLELLNLQNNWWKRFVLNPDEETKANHPLITQAGVGISLSYYEDDLISATGWVSKLDGFIKLSEKERKKLLSDTLELVKLNLYMAATLVDKNTGRPSGKMIQNHHINLSIIINDVMSNDKNENIRLFLPSDIGIGQAGYKDGQFVYSEPYYLNFKVINGLAVSGDKNKFIIENE